MAALCSLVAAAALSLTVNRGTDCGAGKVVNFPANDDTLDCTGAGSCYACVFKCDPNFSCTINCQGDRACPTIEVTCPTAPGTTCEVHCNGDQACQGIVVKNIAGAAAALNMDCGGLSSCSASKTTCPDEGVCDVSCVKEGSCQGMEITGGTGAGDATMNCQEKNSCKSTKLYLGNGKNSVVCVGELACSGLGLFPQPSNLGTGGTDVQCKGLQSCDTGHVECGSGPCKVSCTGKQSCSGGAVTCLASSACDLLCSNEQSCLSATVSGNPKLPTPLMVECPALQSCEKIEVHCLKSVACNTNCAFDQSCKDSKIDCTGPSCSVACTAPHSCAGQNLNCNPTGSGTCALKCDATDACTTYGTLTGTDPDPVTCTSLDACSGPLHKLAKTTPAPPTPIPETPAPVTPVPTPSPPTPAPSTPAPATPAPDTPAPATPAPSTRAPDTVAPPTPAPVTPAPDTPAPPTPVPPTLAPPTPSPDTPAPLTDAPPTPSPPTPAPPTPAPATPAPPTPAPDTPSPPTPAPPTPAPDTPAPPTPAPPTPAPATPAPPTPAPPTPAPATPAPPTPAPDTPAPPTPAPDTLAPPTPAPATPAPPTPSPPTQAPDTAAPATPAPATSAPPTPAPDTLAPPTPSPPTSAPPTLSPVTPQPVTQRPATQAPVTEAPQTLLPATDIPQTPGPTTLAPLTQVPATPGPRPNLTLAETPTPTAPRVSVIPEQDASSLKTGTTVAQLGGLVSVSAGGITSGGKLAVLSNFGCQVEDIDLERERELDWEFHPTMIAFGGGSERYFRAASVMNPLLVLVSLAILMGFAFAVKLLFGISWGRALGNVRSPGMLFIPFVFVLPGTSLVSTQLGLPPNFTDFFAVYGLLLLLVCVASPVLLYLLVCRHIEARATTVLDARLHATTLDDSPVKMLTGWRRVLYHFTFGDRIWLSTVPDSEFVEQYGVIFESYKEGKTWWVLAECSSVVVIGLLSTWQPGSPGECNVRNAIFTTVFGLSFVALIFVRPYLSMFDAALMGSVSGLMFVSVLMMTIGIGAGMDYSSWLYSTAAALLLITTILTFVKAVFDILAYGIDMWLGRKSGAREISKRTIDNKSELLLSEVPPLLDDGVPLWSGEVMASSTLFPPGENSQSQSQSQIRLLRDRNTSHSSMYSLKSTEGSSVLLETAPADPASPLTSFRTATPPSVGVSHTLPRVRTLPPTKTRSRITYI